jgi:moderate conductance mechanosensitive channel
MEGVMDLLLTVRDFFADDRLLANLIGIHIVLGVILVVSFIVRKVLLHGGDSLVRWTGLHWLDQVGKEANRRVRTMMFWTTVLALIVSVAAGIIYHVAGRDLRGDVGLWYQHLTSGQLLAFGWLLGKLALLAFAVKFGIGLVHRGKVTAEQYTLNLLHGDQADSDAMPLAVTGSLSAPDEDERRFQEQTVHHWFNLLERYCLAAMVLGGMWIAGYLIGWTLVDLVVGFLLKFVTIVMVARLATLASKTLFHALEGVGNRHMQTSALRRYWDRIARMFPFGQKCFEAAVYVYAATKCVSMFEALGFARELGEKGVKCIGIFFVTRMVIELLQTLINEAFGMYEEDRPVDQKSLTLVPLLQSVIQYALYFGSALWILHIWDGPTQAILAGAGIVGLAVGLGAQSLVTDLVSGFFILFENQYLVGDIVQIGDAVGRVEGVGIRTTQIRDESGKLFIIPNGQIKNVVNYSKGYVNAVVDFKTATSTNLDHVLADMTEAGRRLRRQRREVLGETVVKGLVELTPGDMTIRAVTKVQPGTHQTMQIEYRRLLKQVLDERQALTKAA